MPGVSFDRAASFYDATRGYPPAVPALLREALEHELVLHPSYRLLELGVGTGRIALPLIQAGYDLTGIDLSNAMLEQFRHKIAQDPRADDFRWSLRQGDIMDLPFPDATFDRVLAIHILHLVSDWQQAMREGLRVLKPGGLFAVLGDVQIDAHPYSTLIYDTWHDILARHGYEQTNRRYGSFGLSDEVEAAFQAFGAHTRRIDLVTFSRVEANARSQVQALRDRIYSSNWSLPDDIHAAASEELHHWLETNHPDPNAALPRSTVVRALIATKPQ